MDLVKEQERLEELQLIEARAKVIKNYLNLVSNDKGGVTAEGIALQKLGVSRLEGTVKEYFTKTLRGKANQKRKPLMHYRGREQDLSFLIISSVVCCLMKKPASVQQLVGILIRNLKNDILLETYSI